MPTPDPWLNIPLADYEGHMNAPEVGQLSVLSELFAEVLASFRPESLAILGIAGGNGLEHIDPQVTRRVVGVDINPAYLEAIRRRHGARLNLELHGVDLAGPPLNLEPVQLVHAALVFEHAGAGRCLENAVALVSPGGILSVVLQLPAASEPNVAATPYRSMQTLAGHFSLIDREWFGSAMKQSGFSLKQEARRTLPAGKAFWMGVFCGPQKKP